MVIGDGRMVRTYSSTWGILVALFGLICFSPNLFAQNSGSYPTSSAAMAACQTRANYFNNWMSGPEPPGSGVTSGSSDCLNSTALKQILGQTQLTRYGTTQYCRMNTTAGQPNFNLCSTNIETFFNSFGYTDDDQDPEPPDPCLTSQSFESTTIRATSTYGGGNACYNDCAYSVGVSYVGTYPAGSMSYDWLPSNRACNSSDVPATTDPLTGPQDLPPADGGVDTNVPDPGPGADEDGKGTSSGGGTCEQAPACSGDPIQCNVLFQTWSTRCEAARIADLNGDNEWADELRESIANLGTSIDGLNDDLSNKLDTNTQAIKDGFDGVFQDTSRIFGSSAPNTDGPIPGIAPREIVIDEDSLDDSGLGLPRSCPAILLNPIEFGFFGNIYSISFDMMCDLLEIVGSLLVVLSTFIAIRIILSTGGK